MSEVTVHVFCDCADCVMRDMVYVRLEEYREKWKKASMMSEEQIYAFDELQKILEGKK